MSPAAAWADEVATLASRHIRRLLRSPGHLIFSVLTPLISVLTYGVVFAEAIPVPGGRYRDFFLGGLLVQTVVMGAAVTATGLAHDLEAGLTNRLLSLPIRRSSILLGRVVSDVARSVVAVLLMCGLALVVGSSVPRGIAGLAAGALLLLLLASAMAWVFALIGVWVSSWEVAQYAGFVWLLPLTYASNAFVPLASLPEWLRDFAAWNPISAFASGVRVLFGNTAGLTPEGYLTLEHPVVVSVAWCALLLAVAVPLSLRRFAHVTTR